MKREMAQRKKFYQHNEVNRRKKSLKENQILINLNLWLNLLQYMKVECLWL